MPNEFKKKTTEKQPKKSAIPSMPTFNLNMAFMEDRRFRIALGFAFVVLAITFFMSFTFFLFNGVHDYSVVESLGEVDFLLLADEVDNNWGVLGATISQYLIMRWFGIGSYSLVLIFGMYGLKYLTDKKVRLLSKVLNFSFFITIWLSITLGYLYAINDDPKSILGLICGGIGYEIAIIFNGLLGWGTILLQLLFLSVYLVYFFNIRSFKELLNPPIEEVSAEPEDDEAHDIEGVQVEEAPIETSDIPEPEEEEQEMVLVIKEAPTEEEVEEVAESVQEGENIDSNIVEGKTTEQEPVIEFESTVVTPKPKIESTELEIEISEEPVSEQTSVEEVEEDLGMEVAATVEEKVGDGEIENYDPKLDLSMYRFPTVDLLEERGGNKNAVTREELEANKDKIVETLANYKIGIQNIKATIGPTVTLYEIVPQAGIKISKIKNLEDDIALSLAALGIRIIAPIPGKGTIGIEVPNSTPEAVSIKSVIASEKFMKSDMDLPVTLGKTITNEIFMVDLAKMPHVLMAGATGQGKSVGLNVMLTSLLYSKHPSQLKFVLVDPKKVELSIFSKIEKHFLAKLPDAEEAIITDTTKVIHTLNSLCIEMDTRYDLLKDALCRNIKEYNKKFVERKLNPNKGHRFLPYIVLVIDELADLMMTAGKEVETPIARLAQLARAIGIHLIVATQRPSVNVITGIIKANFPARVSFRVTSKIDSRTILDQGGADQLIGKGDMLFVQGNEPTRVQCAFVDTPEVEEIVNFIGDQQGYESAFMLPEFVDENADSIGGVDLSDRDVLFEDAARTIVLHQQGSTSLIQRKLKLGYNRAGRIIDQLEAAGIVGPFSGAKARDVLVPDEISLEQLLNELNGKS